MPVLSRNLVLDSGQLDAMAEKATHATNMLKALGHEGRLLILCHLAHREKSVVELERALSLRQPAVSQQLARLRAEGIIKARREGRSVYYSIIDGRAEKIMKLIYELFCG